MSAASVPPAVISEARFLKIGNMGGLNSFVARGALV